MTNFIKTPTDAQRPAPVDADAVIAAVRRATGRTAASDPIALHEPEFRGNEHRYLGECIDTAWVSSMGDFVGQLEAEICEFTGATRAVVTNSGTSALHLCLLLAGVEPGDEVLMPALTFVATANSVSYCGAIPHFVDSERVSLGADAVKLDAHLSRIARVQNGTCVNEQSGRAIRALMPMHTFGHPVDISAIQAVCDRWSLCLVEDAAESLGSSYEGKHTGRFGMISAISFNGNKIVTTGGGGAIITDDAEIGLRAKHLANTARVGVGHKVTHDGVGYNYGMPNLNAALGCAQFEQLPGFLERKRELAERYRNVFADMGGVRFIDEPSYAHSNYWLNSLELTGSSEAERDALVVALNAAGLTTRPCWTLMHRLPMYGSCPRMDLSTAEGLERSVLNIPSSAFLVD